MKRLLVANRGEIAVRILSAARELGICAIAVYTENDGSHISYADEAVQLSGVNTFLNVEEIVSICKKNAVDALHPGYGFLSESAELAARLEQSGIIFVGPSPEILRRTGDKLNARRLAEACGVPVLPALRESSDEAASIAAFAAEVGYPIMLKAVDGGGGRGIRLVEKREQIEAALQRARAESPSNQVFAEKAAVDGWRHVEVQILGDGERVRHFWERECSLQRRYQKIVEIAPSTLSSCRLRAEIIDSAIRIAESIQYNSLGTFEFLVSPTRNEYYFMEINPRLQVEHTITEVITSTDLVHLQLQIASGHSIEDLALDMPRIDAKPPTAVAFQMRVTAEDARNDFALSIGRINGISLPGGNGIRVDTHIEPGMLVSTEFDSLLTKIIVYSPDYITTIGKSLRALGDLSIEGVTTNVDLLEGILLSEAVQSRQCDIQWVEKNLKSIIEAGSAYQRRRGRPKAATRFQATVSAPIPKSNALLIKKGDSWDVSLKGAANSVSSSHNIRIAKLLRNDFPNSFAAEISISSASSSHSDPTVIFNVRKSSVSNLSEGSKVRRKGNSKDPAHLICPLSGQLVEVLIDEGDEVKQYDAVAVIRQMKMELEIRAHRSGIVQSLWDAEEGENINAGTLVCEILDQAKHEAKL